MWNNRMWQLVSAHRVVVMEIHLRARCIKKLHQLCSQAQNWSNQITNALFSISSPVNTRAQSLQSKWKCQKSRRTLLPDRLVLSALSVSVSCRAGKAQTDCRANSKDFPRVCLPWDQSRASPWAGRRGFTRRWLTPSAWLMPDLGNIGNIAYYSLKLHNVLWRPQSYLLG